jgi:hypothetical protein
MCLFEMPDCDQKSIEIHMCDEKGAVRRIRWVTTA